MFDPPITTAANIFVIIAVSLISIGAATTAVDFYKNNILKKKSTESEED